MFLILGLEIVVCWLLLNFRIIFVLWKLSDDVWFVVENFSTRLDGLCVKFMK